MSNNKQTSKNQCQGCTANWPTKEVDLYGKKVIVHLVQGGYNGEIVACTKHLYGEMI